MELILKRIAKTKNYTIGRLYIAEQTNGDNPGLGQPLTKGLQICDTLEPAWRDYRHGGRKIKGTSAIPEGRYPVVITWSEVAAAAGERTYVFGHTHPCGQHRQGHERMHTGGTEPEEGHGAELAHMAEATEG